MSRKYLASLGLAAFLVLAIGIFVRDRLLRTEPPASAPPSEASALQQLSQEGQLRRLADFLSEHVTAIAPAVAFVAETRATGVRWGRGDTLVTTSTDRPAVLVRAPASDTMRSTPLPAPEPARGEWVLIVGRTPSGAVVSSAGMLGGSIAARCGDLDLTEYIIDGALHDGFAGAGLFDLSGRMLGLIVRCGARLMATPIGDVTRVLGDTIAASEQVWAVYGVAVTPLDDRARDHFDADSGLLVTAVRRGTAGDDADLRPGDVLVAIDGRPIASPAEAVALLRAASPASHVVSRRRGASTSDVRLARPDTSLATTTDSLGSPDSGIEVVDSTAPAGVGVGVIRAGSPAAAAGMRRGDRLLRVGTRDVTTAAAARRLLEQARAGSTFIVFERDSVVRGVLLPR
jgi:S1-C subfamily serine protease